MKTTESQREDRRKEQLEKGGGVPISAGRKLSGERYWSCITCGGGAESPRSECVSCYRKSLFDLVGIEPPPIINSINAQTKAVIGAKV